MTVSRLDRLRNRLGGPLDRPIPPWLVSALGRRPAPALDLDRVALLRGADVEELRDPERLERLIPRLGLNDDLRVFPPELHDSLGQGLRSWQYPVQLAPYLVLLSGLGIRRYLELGVEHGGTFVLTTEYLARFNPIERAVAADILRLRSAHAYRKLRPEARFAVVDSATEDFRGLLRREGPFDLALIDGDHAEHAVRRDWDTIRPHARVIAFHDIVDSFSPGVAAVWADIRERHAGEYDFHEFTRQYDEVRSRERRSFLGLGVAVRRG